MGWIWKTKSDKEILRIFEISLIDCLDGIYFHAEDTGSNLTEKVAIFEELYYPCLAGTIVDDLNELDKFKISYSNLSSPVKREKYVAKMVRYQERKLKN